MEKSGGLTFDQHMQFKTLTHPTEPGSLQTLPSELRQQIYQNIFANHNGRQLSRFPYEDYKHKGCRCGAGLSLTNRLFYQETRVLFYKHAGFAFKTPLACNRFLDGIGSHARHIGALSIRFEYCEAHFLRRIFNKFPPASSLHTLHFEYTTYNTQPGLRPIYLPSVQNQLPGLAYDIRLRPDTHPLSRLKNVRKLTIEGDIEIPEVEEAITKLSLKIDDVARRDGIPTRITELKQLENFGHRLPQTLFSTEIQDGM